MAMQHAPLRPTGFSRRRAITIMAAAAGALIPGTDRRAAQAVPLYRWQGTSLGSPSRLLLYHPDRAQAERIVARCTDEIERLERIFALFRPESEIARLNRDGRLDAP